MWLSELRSRAKTWYPGNPGIAPLLAVWLDADPQVDAVLAALHLSAPAFRSALKPYLPPPALEQDQELILACISCQTGGLVDGAALLRFLLAQASHPLTVALSRIGASAPKTGSALVLGLAGQGLLVDAATPALERFGRNLIALANKGAFAALAPRAEAMAGLLDILLRKHKGNPLLTGAPGVGKTALVERLAHEMVNDPAHALAGRPLWAINLGAVVAGTHYRGEFEARMQTLMDEITGEARPIVFIDELHLILGAGRAEGMTMDGANLLKPVLARDEARIIGATTSDEYRLIAKDGALARRFQELHLSAPGGDELQSLIASQARSLALHHGIGIPSELISRAIALADRHLPGREQPDKTLDILDTSAVGARRAGRTVLCLDDLNATLLRLTGLCIGPLNLASRDRLKALQSALNQRVIGQQAVVQTLVATLIHRRLDLRGEERPLGVFLFVGDSGVGKTELARATAECFLGSAARLHRFDLAENAGSEAAVHTLLGAPPGLIGSDQDGSLIRALREPGEQVLLFDEVEKAHLSVQRLLLSLLERGVVHSSHGEALQVRHCLIILTTNAVSSEQLGRLGGIGFGATSMPDPRALLAETFPKEFLGRLDEVLLFRRLDQDDLARILALRLQESVQRLSARGITLDAEGSRLLAHLSQRLAGSGSGARDVTRLIERELLAPIGEALLSAQADAVTIELGDDYYRHGRCGIKTQQHTARHTTCRTSAA